MKKGKQIAAIIGVILLAGMYLVAAIAAFGKSSLADMLFRAALAGTVILPVILYGFLLVARAVKPRKSAVIDTIVFDLIAVLLDIPYDEIEATLPFPARKREALGKVIYGTDVFFRLEKGLIDIDEAIAETVAAAPEQEDVIRYYFAHYNEKGAPFPYTESWLAELKAKGYRLYLLSNWHEYALEAFRSTGRMDFLRYMDGVVFSHKCHYFKPEAGIYEALIQTYGIDPARAIFMDDNPDNVEGAKKAGLPAFVFTGYEDARRTLASLGVK